MIENKKIFSNTIFLYSRMVLILCISLYTTRIVFNTLGINNFGLYNLIAGFVVLFTFLNSAMRSGTQRYLNVGIASNNQEIIRNTFSTALNIHLIIAAIILFLSETMGLWFLNNQLNIASNKIIIANIVYQCTIATTIINVISIPYQAIILAKERMNFYAYLGIFESLSKLTIVFFLDFFINIDVLILYSILLLIVSFSIAGLYFIFVFKNYNKESKYKFKNDLKLMKEMISFSSWNLLSQLALLSSNQGKSILFNVFFGIKINASIAIANQINALIYNFISNLQSAFNPQIVHSFTQKNLERHNTLVLNSSRYSLYLITIISIPFLFNLELLLKIWLGNNLPEHTVSLSKIIIIASVFEAISGPFWMSAHAIGNIKKYQLLISLIFLLNLPISYFLLQLGYSAPIAFSINILISILSLIYRVYYFLKKIENSKSNIILFIKNITFVLFFIFSLIILEKIFNNSIKNLDLITSLFHVLFIEIFFLLYLYIFCITKKEINFIKTYFIK